MEELALIGLSAAVVDGKVVLNWSQWENYGTYRVYCAEEDESFEMITKVKAPGANGYTWSGVKYKNVAKDEVPFEYGVTYRFRVRAELGKNAAGENQYSKYSNVVELTITQDINTTELNDLPPEDTTEEETETTESTESTESTENTGGTESTESTESTENTETSGGTESTESTETPGGTESTESTETPGGTESTESTENTEIPGGTESTESTENTEIPGGTESTESTEAPGVTITPGGTESTENAEN